MLVIVTSRAKYNSIVKLELPEKGNLPMGQNCAQVCMMSITKNSQARIYPLPQRSRRRFLGFATDQSKRNPWPGSVQLDQCTWYCAESDLVLLHRVNDAYSQRAKSNSRLLFESNFWRDKRKLNLAAELVVITVGTIGHWPHCTWQPKSHSYRNGIVKFEVDHNTHE